MGDRLDLKKIERLENNLHYIANMRPVFNRRALFTDTTGEYLIPPEPEPYEKVTVRFRTAKNNVDRVLLVHKGASYIMTKTESNRHFDFYSYELQLENEKVSYYFEIQTGKMKVYYDTRGLAHDVNEYYDFVILPGFKTPQWAKGAVMYQIYVDRFCNGDPANDVETNEYYYIGEPVHKVEDWRR